MRSQAQFDSRRWRERATEIQALYRQIADVRARDELLRVAGEYELIAEVMKRLEDQLVPAESTAKAQR